jgi:hypothetical protein
MAPCAEMLSAAALTNFTCRRRDMLLNADEAALALGGTIAPSLRQRSASYYWRAVSKDTQAKHEAICTKRAGWHLRSFGSHANWALAAEEKCGAKVGVAKLVRRARSNSWRRSLWHMVAASGTRGCSPRHIRLQPLAHMIAGAERRARLVRCSTARGSAGELRCRKQGRRGQPLPPGAADGPRLVGA